MVSGGRHGAEHKKIKYQARITSGGPDWQIGGGKRL